jgi:hypothetical protein
VTEPKQHNSERREFLAHVAIAAAAIATTACAAPLAAATARPFTATAGTGGGAPFDDEWTRRVSAAKHRAVFDSPEVEDGLALEHATSFTLGYREQLGASGADVVPVVVLRHAGTVMAMNDLLWEKFGFGERSRTKDPLTGKDALRNPFLRVAKDEKSPIVSAAAMIESLLANGAIILACNKASMRIANQIAAKSNRDPEEVRAEVRSNIIPGVLLQPSGIYAVLRAQEAGCTFIKST